MQVNKRSTLPRIVVFVFLMVVATSISGQTSAQLTGRVHDAKGAVIPGATVTAERREFRFRVETTTDENGMFKLEGLPRGSYVLTASAPSFGTRAIEQEVPAGSPVELLLEPRGLAAEVSVTTSYLTGDPAGYGPVPGSIERIDARTLENSRVFNFSEALRKISGVNVRDEEGFGLRPNIGIRGTNPTRSTKVLLLEDGIPLGFAPYGDNAAYYHPPVERYESIEVLKGSGQIAYGPQI
jgi:Fe(3+) dicitrate transport protein